MHDPSDKPEPPPAPPEFVGSAAAPADPVPHFEGYGPPSDASTKEPGHSQSGFRRRWRQRLGRNAH